MHTTTQKQRLLIVDDAPATLEVLQRNLALHGFQVASATGVSEARKLLEASTVDLVITDLKMPGASGVELVHYVREKLRDTEILVISGYPPPEAEQRTGDAGPAEFLSKPFTQEELLSSVRRTLERLRIRRAARGRAGIPVVAPLGLAGSSETAQRLFAAIRKAAVSSAPVLVTGEPGTEREEVARAIHYSGPRAAAPFVVVRCGGIPEGYVETALFGRGGQDSDGSSPIQPGLFQAAEGGTVYLDGVCELGLGLQERVLRFLRDKEILTPGSPRPRVLDLRVIASSACPLSGHVEAGDLLQDLYGLLSAATIAVPPLRERAEDVAELVRAIVFKASAACGRQPSRFSQEALDLMKRYPWPGNLREVENVVQRLVLSSEGGLIGAASLPVQFRATAQGPLQNRTLAAAEAAHIATVLAEVGGNKSRAAQILNIDRKTLREKLKILAATQAP